MSLRILHALRAADSDAGRSIEAICGLFTAQRQFGHVVEVVTVGQPGDTSLDRLGIPLHRLGSGGGSYGYDAAFVPWMKEHAGGYNCVIVHGVWNFCAFGTWRALRDAAVPYFVFTHGMLDPWLKHHHPLMHILKWLYWPWGGYPVLRDAHAVLFLCEDERLRARETFWLYDCHEFVVRSGTRGIPEDLAEGADGPFLSAHPDLREKRLFTLFADSDRGKGALEWIRAIDGLSRKGIWDGRSMRLVIAGSADPAAEAAARRLAGRCGLGGCVHWAGVLTEPERWGALCASEVFLRPSAFEVCCSRVMDALSAGVPVLLSTGVSIWKDIVNDRAGFADSETADGCARLFGRWIGLSPEDQAAMRARTRRCFAERYTQVGAAHALSSAIYLMVGVHRDKRWDLKPLKPASELS